MKKSIKLFALFAAITFAANSSASELGIKMSNLNLVNYKPASKSKSSSGGIEKGLVQLDFSFTANAGTSRLYFGRRGYYGGGTGWYYGSFVRPGFLLNIDGAVHKYVSVGGYIGFDASVGRSGFYYSSYAPTYGVGFGVRGVFHIYQLISDKASNAKVDPGKLDFYAAVHLGGNLLFGKYIYNDNGDRTVYGGISAGVVAGVRYYFTPKFGLVGQVGFGEMGSFFKAGLAVKL
jgi:hypothetical protein